MGLRDIFGVVGRCPSELVGHLPRPPAQDGVAQQPDRHATDATQALTVTETAVPEKQPTPSVTSSATVVQAGATAIVTQAPADASPLIFPASEGQARTLPDAGSSPRERTYLNSGLALLGLAILSGVGMGTVMWQRRSKDHRRGDA